MKNVYKAIQGAPFESSFYLSGFRMQQACYGELYAGQVIKNPVFLCDYFRPFLITISMIQIKKP